MYLKYFATSAVVLFVSAHLALAGGVAVGVGGTPPTVFPGSLTGINVGDDEEPIQIFLDPEADFWPKTFQIDVTDVGLASGTMIPVWEHIQLIPPTQEPPIPELPLTDWHEEIHTPNWQWTSGTLTVHNIPLDVPGVVGGPASNFIWFDWGFPLFPTPVPLDIWIHKELLYLGPDIPPGSGELIILVDIWEHPTVPEPSTLVLAVVGAVALSIVGLRRRRTL